MPMPGALWDERVPMPGASWDGMRSHACCIMGWMRAHACALRDGCWTTFLFAQILVVNHVIFSYRKYSRSAENRAQLFLAVNDK